MKNFLNSKVIDDCIIRVFSGDDVMHVCYLKCWKAFPVEGVY